jgi:holo-[acyl-carrier protein] synthase
MGFVVASPANSACRWAMKEAAYKALYPTVTARWKELTYQGLAEGRKPTLYYHPFTPGNSEKVGRLHASVSHDGDYVFTSVLVECPPTPTVA